MFAEWMTYINNLATSMPVIGGTMAVTISGGIIAAIWKGPAFIAGIFRRNLTVSFTVNNAGHGGNVEQFLAFLNWFPAANIWKYSRAIGHEGGRWGEGATGPGIGVHWFIFNRRLYWATISPLPSTGSDKEKRQIEIRTLGVNFKSLLALFNDFMYREEDGGRWIKQYREKCWFDAVPIPARKWETVILPEATKERLTSTIESFLASREWYATRGIPYKLVIMLYGEPGTGKTSLIKALAHKYAKNIASVELHGLSDSSFPLAMANVPRNSFVAMEDFDTVKSVHSRTEEVPHTTRAPVKSIGSLSAAAMDDLTGLNLATILNTLDGLVELDGQIIFMTTNHPEVLDPALVRPGRVDLSLEITLLETPEILTFCEMAYPGYTFTLPSMSGITGGRLQQLSLEYRDDPEGFEQALVGDKAQLHAA